ncbi:hypothetical protein [Sinosporangium siamense]|uniref:Uncharacterized protein n=1 Tax=Sinosporangium siamense TaxID=1367973 RepID=A0A919RLJ3_9ACTN|nr:hypothetical protein [Sinosporangium siamense]GII96025.1 hypothetical protein Ssi02_62560 [Sinosporangium siamense]
MALDLATGMSMEVAPRKQGSGATAPDAVCGERGESHPGGLIVMLRPAGEVTFVGTADGKIHRRVPVGTPPVSVLVLPR